MLTHLAVATRGGVTQTWTYKDYFEDIKKAARSFIKVQNINTKFTGFNSLSLFINCKHTS